MKPSDLMEQWKLVECSTPHKDVFTTQVLQIQCSMLSSVHDLHVSGSINKYVQSLCYA